MVVDKPHLNVGTFGGWWSGKTTLTAAITKVLGQPVTVDQIHGHLPPKPAAGREIRSVTARMVEYQTPARHYTHLDCPGYLEYRKHLLAGLSQMDGGILVVPLGEPHQEALREQILLARHLGPGQLVVFLNQTDLPDAHPQEIETLTRRLLQEYGYAAEQVGILWGSAQQALECGCGDTECPKCAPVVWLTRQLDAFCMPTRDPEGPFLLWVDEVFTGSQEGAVVAGTVDQGTVRHGQQLELLGFNGNILVTASQIEMFHRRLEQGEAGMNLGILLAGMRKDAIHRGEALAAPGSVTTFDRCRATIHVVREMEGGRHAPFRDGFQPQLHVKTADVTATVRLPSGMELAEQGRQVEAQLRLLHPLALAAGTPFVLREGGHTVGTGEVISCG